MRRIDIVKEIILKTGKSFKEVALAGATVSNEYLNALQTTRGGVIPGDVMKVARDAEMAFFEAWLAKIREG